MLCHREKCESHDHLFFFVNILRLFGRCCLPTKKKLTDHVLAYQERRIGCVPICTSRIYELSLAASIHQPTWRERNNQNFKLFVSLLIIWVRELLKKLGTSCICSWRNLKPTDENRILAKGWGVGARIIGAVKCELPCFASCMAMPRVCGLFAFINKLNHGTLRSRSNK